MPSSALWLQCIMVVNVSVVMRPPRKCCTLKLSTAKPKGANTCENGCFDLCFDSRRCCCFHVYGAERPPLPKRRNVLNPLRRSCRAAGKQPQRLSVAATLNYSLSIKAAPQSGSLVSDTRRIGLEREADRAGAGSSGRLSCNIEIWFS